MGGLFTVESCPSSLERNRRSLPWRAPETRLLPWCPHHHHLGHRHRHHLGHRHHHHQGDGAVGENVKNFVFCPPELCQTLSLPSVRLLLTYAWEPPCKTLSLYSKLFSVFNSYSVKVSIWEPGLVLNKSPQIIVIALRYIHSFIHALISWTFRYSRSPTHLALNICQ